MLRACGPNSLQLITILHPLQGRFPTTEQEFDAMALVLRCMGHILEGTYDNVASQLRAAPTRTFFGVEQPAAPVDSTDPWGGGNDPWSQGAAASASHANTRFVATHCIAMNYSVVCAMYCDASPYNAARRTVRRNARLQRTVVQRNIVCIGTAHAVTLYCKVWNC